MKKYLQFCAHIFSSLLKKQLITQNTFWKSKLNVENRCHLTFFLHVASFFSSLYEIEIMPGWDCLCLPYSREYLHRKVHVVFMGKISILCSCSMCEKMKFCCNQHRLSFLGRCCCLIRKIKYCHFLYLSLATSINIMNTQEHHSKLNVGLGHRKTRRLSCQGVPKVTRSTLNTLVNFSAM